MKLKGDLPSIEYQWPPPSLEVTIEFTLASVDRFSSIETARQFVQHLEAYPKYQATDMEVLTIKHTEAPR